ncbi:alpha/beta hydrolase [Xanthomonas arboricola]|uniref:alpha/beta hydrolase n=1 Tax=Xanthomonas arboricola TaxID=56448 RepID=UPI000CEF01B6|nr:alpha/beta hydrolase [Xanthomonas arboricola]PPU38853.1 alpha/beta hydrolase [Xanthomonas arboricola pv. populi]
MQITPFDPGRLSPQVQAVLARIAAGGDPPLASLPIPALRQAYKQIGAMLGGDPLPVGSVRELAAAGPAGPIPLRLYLPEGGQAPHAATVYLHGGGWTVGDLDSHDKVCRRLLHAAGCAVVAVDYRLAPEHPAPAGPDDVVAAIAWLAAQAGALGLDPARLAVAGDSAGGSLSAVATQQLRGKVALRAQVLFYPSTDLSPASAQFPSRRENGAVPPLTLELMHALSDPFVPAGCDTLDPRVSPLRAADLQGLPPALVFAGQCDVLRDDAYLYAAALRQAGVPVEYIEVPGMVHGFLEMAGVLQAAREAFTHAGAFLRGHLA